MTPELPTTVPEHDSPPSRRALPAPARRALDEAAARRKAAAEPLKEIGGRGGLDPARFGDWEVKGLASDF